MMLDDPVRPSTDKIHDETYPGMSRRRLLSSLTGLGFTQITAKYITKDDIDNAASDEVPIVVGFHSENPASEQRAYKEYVPADWYNDFRHATQIKQRMEKSIGQTPGVVSVGVIPGERGGDNSRVLVRAQKNRLRTAMGNVPTEIDGVEISVESANRFTSMGCANSLRNWDSSQSSIHGGYEIWGDSSNPIGTVGAPAFKNGRKYLATCQHIFSGSNPTGKKLKHPDGTVLGTINKSKCKEDFAMVSLNSGYRIERSIRHSGYSGIAGYYSHDGLANLKSRNVRTQKVGRTTCRTSFSRIQSTAETIFTAPGCVPKPYTVFHQDNSGNSLKRGDSGSISFHQSPNNKNKCWLVSFINYEDSGTNNVFGIGLYRLADFGYSF